MPVTSESYDLQRMQATQSNSKIMGRFDPIHIGLAVLAVIFIILSIVFIILFATKHDSSSAFLSTGFTAKSKDEVSNDLQNRLKNKYTVNSFAVDVQNGEFNAIYSLRGSISADEVQKVIAQSQVVTQPQTTYGDKAYSVCHQQQVFQSTALPTSPVPNTSTAPTSTKPPQSKLYCDGSRIQRDVVIVVDMNNKISSDGNEKLEALKSLKTKLSTGVDFASTNVFLSAVVGNEFKNISTNFIVDNTQFNTDFDALLAIAGSENTTYFNVGVAIDGASSYFPARKSTPGEIIVLTDKFISSASVNYKRRDNGIYKSLAGVNQKVVNAYSDYVDQTLSATNWTELANIDPFSQLICAFYNPESKTQLSSRFMRDQSGKLDQTNNPKCEVLDIIIAFDTSMSLSETILDKYKAFAKKFVAQYKYNGDENTRVGIITFESNVVEKLTLKDGNNLNAINAAIDSVIYTRGLTDVTKALNTADDLFNKENIASHGEILIVLSDAMPTVGTYDDEVAAGQKLAGHGVSVFFIGYSSYSDDVKKQLGRVTNPNYVFGDMSDATFTGVTNEIVEANPCPLPKCVTAYYAVEVSEATGANVSHYLEDILRIAEKAVAQQSGTESYQLVTYNEGNTQFKPTGDASYDSFRKYVQNLINDPNAIRSILGGKTRLDTAINDITAELNSQLRKNPRFSPNIIFFGQANDGVLDPDAANTDAKRKLLSDAAYMLHAQTADLIYVVDDSGDDPADFGVDLWSSVTPVNRIIVNSDHVETALDNTDYYKKWATLSCQLPELATCYDTLLDIALIIDLQNKDDDFMNYITNFATSFSSEYATHIGMAAYGLQKSAFLSNLASHTSQDLQNSSNTYGAWRDGSFFTTTLPPTTATTPFASSTIDAMPPRDADIILNNYYQVNTNTITSLFETLMTQFGCPNYSDDGDRLFAPNIFIFASDNYDQYTNDIWSKFAEEKKTRFGCNDCAGTPTFIFLSRTDAKAPADLGVTVNLSKTDLDIDASDDTSTKANINKFNNLVNSVCETSLIQCPSYSCYQSS